MKTDKELLRSLLSMEGKSYGLYRSLKGEYSFENFLLKIDKVQADPFAPPSKMRAIIKKSTTGIPEKIMDSKSKRIAISDFLTRTFYSEIKDMKSGRRSINIDKCGQEIVERTSVIIREKEIEVRFEAELPASGRRIMGREAKKLFEEILPEILENTFMYRNIDKKRLERHITLYLDQEYIRKELKEKRLVAFVGNGSILPRESGISVKPLISSIPFKSPDKFRVTLKLPSGKEVSGMGLKKGITLVVGGGYHGKSTLLNALELGVYNHIEGDGREYVITDGTSMKIRAEDGRNVEKVNISPFINNLPQRKDTRAFSTENASGSTSQAANVMESLEMGSKLLLIDEDTSATNFMIRDNRMKKLIVKEKEPITPFTDKIKSLYEDYGVSTILIVGGSGDYFEVADSVIMMDEYVPVDVTDKAKKIAFSSKEGKEVIEYEKFGEITKRTVLRKSFQFSGKEGRVKAKGKNVVQHGKENIDISYLEQLLDAYQTNGIAVMLEYFKENLVDGKTDLKKAVDNLYSIIEERGLAEISSYTSHPGNYSLPRKQEFIGAINRYRGLKIR